MKLSIFEELLKRLSSTSPTLFKRLQAIFFSLAGAILVLILLLGNCSMVGARWATFADAPVEVVTNNIQATINVDGSFEALITKKLKILNERGREINAKIPLYYNFDNSSFDKEKYYTANLTYGNKINIKLDFNQ